MLVIRDGNFKEIVEVMFGESKEEEDQRVMGNNAVFAIRRIIL